MLRTEVEDTFELTDAEESVRQELEKGLSLLAATHEGGGIARNNLEFWMNKYASGRGVKSVLAELLSKLPRGTTLCIR